MKKKYFDILPVRARVQLKLCGGKRPPTLGGVQDPQPSKKNPKSNYRLCGGIITSPGVAMP